MRALLAYVVRGRSSAIMAVLLGGVLPVVGPYLSGGVIGLVTLRHGYVEGGMVLAAACALLGGLWYFVWQTLAPIAFLVGLAWLPTWLLAAALRYSASQSFTLVAAWVLGALAILGFHLFVPDAARWWREHLDVLEVFFKNFLQVQNVDSATAGEVDRLLERLYAMMTGIIVAGVVFGAMLTVFLARWWHAILDNPGGFGREFREIRLGPRVGAAVLILGLIAIAGSGLLGGVGLEVVSVALMLYVFQGLALVHGMVALTGASVGWLVGLYVLLLLAMPHALMALALGGYLDTWANFRARIRSRGGGT